MEADYKASQVEDSLIQVNKGCDHRDGSSPLEVGLSRAGRGHSSFGVQFKVRLLLGRVAVMFQDLLTYFE